MIQILLVDDQAIIRDSMTLLLQQAPDFQVVGTADSGQRAIEQVAALRPDLVLCDIEMPGMSGIAATQVIHQRFPQTKVIVLSSHDDEVYLANALRAGAKGYLLKNSTAADLIDTVRLVQRGHSQMGPGLVEKIVDRVTEPRLTAKFNLSALKLSEADFRLLLEHFDVEVLPKLVEEAIAHALATPMLAYLKPYLESRPTSLAALYLAGALIHRSRQPGSALLYLKFGFEEGVRQQLAPAGLLLFYREGCRISSEAAAAWLTQSGSPWADDWPFLLAEAADRSGTDSLLYRSLRLLWRIRAMRQISDRTLELVPKLAVLQSGFDFDFTTHSLNGATHDRSYSR